MTETKHTIVINSLDRNWENGDSTFSFYLNHDDIIGILSKSYSNITSIHVQSLIIPNFFIDINSVHCSQNIGLTQKNNGLLMRHIPSFPRLSDLKYLILQIDTLKGNLSGSSSLLNDISSVFIYDNTIQSSTFSNLTQNVSLDSNNNTQMFSDTNIFNQGEGVLYNTRNEFLVFKNVSDEKDSIDEKTVSNMEINVLKPDGEVITLLNDSLSLKNISSPNFIVENNPVTITNRNMVLQNANNNIQEGMFVDSTFFTESNIVVVKKTSSTVFELDRFPGQNSVNQIISLNFRTKKIEIECDEYFSSEEYRLGDIMLFKNIAGVNQLLSSYLYRDKGHSIVGLGKSDKTSTFYNKIEILPEFKISKQTGSETLNYFGLNTVNTDQPSAPLEISGKTINFQNQMFIGMDIYTK